MHYLKKSTAELKLKEAPENLMARIQGSMNAFGIAVTSVSSVIGGAIVQWPALTFSFSCSGILQGWNISINRYSKFPFQKI